MQPAGWKPTWNAERTLEQLDFAKRDLSSIRLCVTPGTGDLVHCDDGTAIRTLTVWRGQTFTEVLRAELTAARLRSMEERRPPPL